VCCLECDHAAGEFSYINYNSLRILTECYFLSSFLLFLDQSLVPLFDADFLSTKHRSRSRIRNSGTNPLVSDALQVWCTPHEKRPSPRSKRSPSRSPRHPEPPEPQSKRLPGPEPDPLAARRRTKRCGCGWVRTLPERRPDSRLEEPGRGRAELGPAASARASPDYLWIGDWVRTWLAYFAWHLGSALCFVQSSPPLFSWVPRSATAVYCPCHARCRSRRSRDCANDYSRR
jgi:hypothetical protein